MPDAAPFAPPPVCPECGYALAGLPPAGRCPECGWACGEEVVIFAAGFATGNERWVARWAGILAALAAVNASLSFGGIGGRWVMAALSGGWALCCAWFCAKQVLRRRKGRVGQARFGPLGFARRVGFGPVRWRPWEARHTPELVPLEPGADEGQRRRYALLIDRPKVSLIRGTWPFMWVKVEAAPGEAEALVRRVRALRDAAVGTREAGPSGRR